MAEDLYQMLQISPEADAVRAILQPREQPQRQFYGSPQAQSLSDYHSRIEQDIATRDDLAQDAEILRRINLPTARGAQARAVDWQKALEKAAYEKQTSALMDDLRKLDPADPEHQTQQDEIIAKHPIARTALSDPRISGIVKRQSHDYEEMQSLFDKDSVSRQEYANLRVSGLDPDKARQQVRTNAQKRADRVWFAMQGGNPEDFDSGKFNLPDGTPDKAKMAYYLAQKKGSEDSLLSSVERKALDEAAKTLNANRLNPDLDEDKISAFRAQFNKAPESTEDWQMAYDLAKNSGGDKREAMAALISDFQRAGKSVPDFYRSMVGMAENPSQNSVRGTDSTNRSGDAVRSQTLSGVPQQPVAGAPLVSGVQSGVQSNLASGKTPNQGAAPQGVRQVTSQLGAQEGQNQEAAVQGVPQPQQPNAPLGLQQTSGSGVVVPTSPSGDGQAASVEQVQSIQEREQPQRLTPQEELANRAKTRDVFNRHWTAAKGDLQKTLEAKKGSKLADDPAMLKSLLRSIQVNEAVRPEQVGLSARQDKLGGAVFENPVDLLAKFLGKDPDAVAEVELEAGGKKYPLVDLPGGTHTWRDVIKAWADEQVPTGSSQAVGGRADFSKFWGGK